MVRSLVHAEVKRLVRPIPLLLAGTSGSARLLLHEQVTWLKQLAVLADVECVAGARKFAWRLQQAAVAGIGVEADVYDLRFTSLSSAIQKS